jgi:hypothetical protein
MSGGSSLSASDHWMPVRLGHLPFPAASQSLGRGARTNTGMFAVDKYWSSLAAPSKIDK